MKKCSNIIRVLFKDKIKEEIDKISEELFDEFEWIDGKEFYTPNFLPRMELQKIANKWDIGFRIVSFNWSTDYVDHAYIEKQKEKTHINQNSIDNQY